MKNKVVTAAQIDAILAASTIEFETVFGKTLVMKVLLPSGFVLIESASWFSASNYKESVGYDLCLGRIANKVWELEGYRLQCELQSAQAKQAAKA